MWPCSLTAASCANCNKALVPKTCNWRKACWTLLACPYTSTVLVGRSAKTIVEAAQEHGCDHIVFGTEQTSLASKIFGSLAQQVRQLLGTRADVAQVIGS